MKIYLVRGLTGDYDGGKEWNVKAFFDKEKAEELRESLNVWCENEQCSYDYAKYKNPFPKRPPNDPYFACYSPGVDYLVEELEIE